NSWLRSENRRMRPAVKPANRMKPRETKSVSATAGLLPAVPLLVDQSAPTSMYDRSVPYSVCVRRSTLIALRTRKPKLEVSVRVSRPPASLLPPPIGMLLVLLLKVVWTRTNEPIFKHVSVAGTYQKPAPYRLQTFTYSTGLAFRGRSAACAAPTATNPAAEPRRSLFIVFIEAPCCPLSPPPCPTPDGHPYLRPANRIHGPVSGTLKPQKNRRCKRPERCSEAILSQCCRHGAQVPTLPLMQNGKLRGLAVTTLKRQKWAPELSTVAESGLPGFEVSSWYGLFAPAKTPPEIIGKISADAQRVARDPDFVQRLADIATTVVGSNPEGLRRHLKAEMDKWGPVIMDAQIRP